MKRTPTRRTNLEAQTTQTFLGIEGGATRSTAVLMDANGRVLKRAEGGPCNLVLISDAQVLKLWKGFRQQLTASAAPPAAVGIFLAGNRRPADAARMIRLMEIVWPRSRHVVGNDSLSAMAAALGNGDGIVLICGTGSIVRARRGDKNVQIGGWGSLGGDRGSGYWMGRELVRGVIHDFDKTGAVSSIGQSSLNFLGLNTMEELATWTLDAPKDEVASLTKVIFRRARDPLARHIIREAADLLAEDVAIAARKAGLRAPLVALNQGLAKHQPLFFKALDRAISKQVRGAKVFISEVEGAVGAARLARAAVSSLNHSVTPPLQFSNTPSLPSSSPPPVSQRGLSVALTEQRNPRTVRIDKMSVPRVIDVMLDEELRALPKIRTQRKEIGRVIDWIVDSQKKGGRLFYIGAGTSGRVGVLDASECPPTYGLSADAVQGIMAGGWRALYQSLESAEDDASDGQRIVHDRGITKNDVLVGIAASGSTPFVLGALEEAHRIGARVALLTFNPAAKFTIRSPRFQKIVIPTGPEVVTGSTRLKAGTATKLVLNMLSTISMIRLGKVQSNFMTNFAAHCCEKAQDRATRIYMALRRVSYAEAWRRLEAGRWNLKGLLEKR
jgi:N-acetylmuramic acid 6-phosphate etherase